MIPSAPSIWRRNRRLGLHRGPRRGGIGILIFFLLGVVAILALGYYWEGQSKQEKKLKFQVQRSDPQSLLDRLILELSRKHSYSDGSWEIFLELISGDDHQWLDQNARILAGLNGQSQGRTGSMSERELRYYALEYLLRFGWTGERLVVVRVGVDPTETFAVAYVHPPARVDQLREIFLISEAGRWKVRRFLGARDDPAVILPFLEARKAAGLELLTEEQAFAADPRGSAARKRAELLALVGLTPDQAP
jgi:hypothetical protein